MPERLTRHLPAVLAGLLAALIDVPVLISFAALIFSGPLEPFTANAVGFLLAGAIVIPAIIALLSSYPGTVGLPHETAAAVMAAIAGAIVAAMAGSASAEAMFLTVLAAMMAASLLTGLTFLLLGWPQRGRRQAPPGPRAGTGRGMRLSGNLVRYMPTPVIGGFLAGTGWLLVAGGLGIMTGTHVDASHLADLFHAEELRLWLPGLAYAVLLFLATRRWRHFLVLPLGILAGQLVFYAWMALAGLSFAEAGVEGLLLGPFPQGRLWQVPLLDIVNSPPSMGGVDWSVLLGQAGQLISLVIISALSLLLNVSGLELATGRDLDVNQELRSAGAANIAGGLVGSVPGFPAVSMTDIGFRLGANSRLIGLTLAATAAGVMFFAVPILAVFPRVVVGGLAVILGLGLLTEWVVEGWSRFSRADMAVVFAILVAIALWGPLPGVALGLALAAGKFILQYSRLPAVRHSFTGLTVSSNVSRPRWQELILEAYGDLIVVLELQGFLFFGTAAGIVERLDSLAPQAFQGLAPREQAEPGNPVQRPPRFLVMDFRYVRELDDSARYSFLKIRRMATARGLIVVCTHLAPGQQQELSRVFDDATHLQGPSPAPAGEVEGSRYPEAIPWLFFPDLDHGLEWCEEQVIELVVTGQVGVDRLAQSRADAADQASVTAPAHADADEFPREKLAGYLQRLELAPGQVLIHEGDPPAGLFYIDSGRVTATLVEGQPAGRPSLRLRTMLADTVVGEVSTYLGQPASATVVAEEPSAVYLLSLSELRRLEVENPALAHELHHFIIRLLAERLHHNVDFLHALAR